MLPRILALTLVLPLLVFYANAMALLGGAVMCWAVLGISLPAFLAQFEQSLIGWTFWLGLIKAPVFALLIALTGCFEGFRVARSAESVGRQTTASVVEAIFLVIIADAAFSILFSYLRL